MRQTVDVSGEKTFAQTEAFDYDSLENIVKKVLNLLATCIFSFYNIFSDSILAQVIKTQSPLDKGYNYIHLSDGK